MDFFKLPTKIMVVIALATGMILFLPDTFYLSMYLDGFRNEYGFSNSSIANANNIYLLSERGFDSLITIKKEYN